MRNEALTRAIDAAHKLVRQCMGGPAEDAARDLLKHVVELAAIFRDESKEKS